MERAKLASYLMMASHVLASENWGDDHDDDDNIGFGANPVETSFGGRSTRSLGGGRGSHHVDELSPELKETNVVLSQFLLICSKAVGPNSSSRGTLGGDQQDGAAGNYSPSDLPSQVVRFAPSAIRDHVLNRLADKFMEVALDVHSMTPDIYQTGATVFARDVQTLLGYGRGGGDDDDDDGAAATGCCYSELPLLLRLLDLTHLMSLDSSSLQVLSGGLTGLAGVTYLDSNDFASDATLNQEAMSMIQAKGFKWLELGDVISVLNRRRDL